MLEILNKCLLFKDVENIENALEGIQYQIKEYNSGNVIASRKEEVKNLMIVLEGSVRGEIIDFAGNVLKIEDIEAPKPIALAFIFGPNSYFPVDVIANKKVKLLFIQKENLLKLFHKEPIINHNFLNAISGRTQFLSQRIWFLSLKSIKAKIAHYILDMDRNGSGTIMLPMNQKELSEFFGVTRPSLARELSEMKNNDIISLEGKMLKILDRETLKEYAV